MKKILLSQSTLVTITAVQNVLEVIFGSKIVLRDCTVSAREWNNVPLENDARWRFTDLEGHFFFEGDEEHPQNVEALIQTRSYVKDGSLIGHLEQDASHEIRVNGTKYLVWFENPRAFRVLELDGLTNNVCREYARSAAYDELQKLSSKAAASA